MAFTEIKRENNNIVNTGGQSGFVEIDIPRIAAEGSEDIPGYLDQIVQNFGKRMKNQEKLTKSWKAGEMDSNTGLKLGPFSEEGSLDDMLGDFSYNAQSAMKTGSGTVLDVVGVGVGAVIDGIQVTMPVTSEAIKDVVSYSWDWTMNTEGGQEAQKAFAGTEVVYKKWKKENPNLASLFEGVVNTFMVFGPVRFKNKVGPVEGSKLSSIVSDKVISSGVKSQAKEKRIILERMLAPKVTENKVLAGNQAVDSSALSGPKLQFTIPQNEVLDYLVTLKGVNPKKGPTNTNIAINKSQIKLVDEISKILTQHKDLKIPIKSTEGKINYNISQAMEGFPSLKSNASINNSINLYKQEAKKILLKHKSNPQGVHNARIEFDRFMKNELNSGVLSQEAKGLNSTLAKAIRNGMNSSIDDVLPSTFSIASRRKQQNLNYRAIELLAPKIANQGADLAHFFQNITRVNKSRATAASAGVLMGSAVTPYLGYTVMGIGTAVSIAALTNILVRGAVSGEARVALGVILREADKAIKNTVNYEMKKSLLSGKALVVDLLNNSESEKKQEQ
mgnify:CR=1 FL=1